MVFKLLLTCTFIFSSGSEPPKEQEEKSNDPELSLKQDREELDSLRKDIPEDVKRENDDLAFILKLFDDKKRKPGKIQSQFNKVYNRNRKKKQNEFKKERKQFTKAEKKGRKDYQKELKKKKEEFLDSDPSHEAKKEFFADERIKRKEYYSEEREKRKEFESEMRAKRRQFDDFMKDRRKDFDDRLRQFKKDQREMRKMEKKMKQQRARGSSSATTSQISPENQKYIEEFNKIPKKGGHKLAPKEDK